MKKSQPGSRASARIAAVQALYEMDMTDAAADPILNEFMAARWHKAGHEETETDGSAVVQELPPFDDELLREIVNGVAEHTAVLDQHIGGALTGAWTVERLEVLIRVILRAGVYELLHKIDVPVRVVINEYMGVAHAFFSGTEPNLINGVMDKLAREIRVHEVGDKSKSGAETASS